MLLRRLDVGGELGGSGCLYMRAIDEVFPRVSLPRWYCFVFAECAGRAILTLALLRCVTRATHSREERMQRCLLQSLQIDNSATRSMKKERPVL